jgi:hypothetical protein
MADTMILITYADVFSLVNRGRSREIYIFMTYASLILILLHFRHSPSALFYVICVSVSFQSTICGRSMLVSGITFIRGTLKRSCTGCAGRACSSAENSH